MSDTTPPGRDGSGRFVKAEEAPSPVPPEEMHPVSRILFGWVGASATSSILLWGTLLLGVLLVLIDYGIDRRAVLALGGFNGFYAAAGLAAVVVSVLVSWILGKLLRRDEDYYGEGDTTPYDVAKGDEP
ncbi:MAG: hypothetical protein AAGI03_08760 [Pseudomonadota bacterium]